MVSPAYGAGGYTVYNYTISDYTVYSIQVYSIQLSDIQYIQSRTILNGWMVGSGRIQAKVYNNLLIITLNNSLTCIPVSFIQCIQ
jgi:hypothetical protein